MGWGAGGGRRERGAIDELLRLWVFFPGLGSADLFWQWDW